MCSVKAGLTQGGTPAQVDTSAGSSSTSSSSSSKSTSSNTAKTDSAKSNSTATDNSAKASRSESRAQAPKAATKETTSSAKQDAPKQTWKNKSAANTAKGSYTVKSGDTLSKIATGLGVDWHTLYNNNTGVVGGNPDLIYPGQVLSV